MTRAKGAAAQNCACKCCGSASSAFADVDFNRTCEVPGAPPFQPSGERVPYRRCNRCGFVFTTYFDNWTPDEMAARIYNEDYIRVDPDFARTRPVWFSNVLSAWLQGRTGGLRGLDYGGGQGLLAARLRAFGLAFDSYDPYFTDDPLPDRRYQLVTAFEVAEHSDDPRGWFATIDSLLEPDGALLFSTSLLPRRATGDWQYIAPRNGHVSIYTPASLRCLAHTVGRDVVTLDDMHLMFRRAGDPLPRLLLARNPFNVLWHASHQDVRALWRATRAVAAAGCLRAACDPRHLGRLLLRRP